MSPLAAILIAGLLAAQPADGIRLARGQELVYRGTYSETTGSDSAPFRTTYEIETRVFVCDALPTGYRIAFCTTLKSSQGPALVAVRFEMASVEPNGRVRLDSGASPPFVPDGPPALGGAGFVERPV